MQEQSLSAACGSRLGSAVLVCLLQPDAADVQRIVQAVLGGLTCHAGLTGLGLIGREQLQMDLVCHIHTAHGLGGLDLQIKHIRVGHAAVIQLIVLADEGLAFISQLRSKWHRESLPIILDSL